MSGVLLSGILVRASGIGTCAYFESHPAALILRTITANSLPLTVVLAGHSYARDTAFIRPASRCRTHLHPRPQFITG